jgi:ubiquinone biosynthesis protein
MNAHATGLARNAQILRFLLRYRHAGVFTGLDLDSASLELDHVDTEGADPDAFVTDLEALGPTFVKIGQALSTRPDMVPAPYIVALQRMQDRVAPVPVEAIRQVFEAELGVRLSKAFMEFDPAPLGCASLAQVHRAVLRDGRQVAVKVQRPDIAEMIRSDIDTLAGLADRADRFTDLGRRLRFGDWVHEFRKTLLAELDYRIEAENLARFSEHFADYPELFVPSPIVDMCATRVLTMDLVHGTKVTELSGLRRTEQDLGALGEALVRGYIDQMFVYGEIHADPHPGNMLVTHDGRLGLFDLGQIAHVPPKQRERLLKLLFAAVDGRGEEAAHESIAMGTRLEDFDAERYLREVGQLVARYAAHAGSQSLSEGRLVVELVRIATACGLRTPPELSLLGKTLLNLEQVAVALDPDLDVKAIVEGHIQHVMRERLRQSFSPANVAGELLEVQALLRESPRKISDILSLLAENRLQVCVAGLEESRLMENLQKIANRISAGVITAALIIGSALLMRVDTPGAHLLGYPALAMVMFLVGSALGLMLVWSALRRDRKARPREERGPR